MDKSLQKKTGKIFLTILVFVVLFANALYWCNKKEGYYIDELWSYGLSNSYYAPFLQDKENYMDKWHQPSFYKDYLIVKENETFSYGSVYYNQTQDVHPPFYYMLLHTICSFFPDCFSKWFGLFLNLFFYEGSLFILYRLGGLILGKENYFNLIPPLLYGFCIGGISTLIYIRMYMMVTFWALLLVYLGFLFQKTIISKTAAHQKDYLLLIGIGLTIMAGFLTQYYFLIFAFFFSVAYVVWCLFMGKKHKAVEYSIVVCIGIVGGILIFPASLRHIFMGNQGRQAFTNAFNGLALFLNRLMGYRDVVISELFGSGYIISAILLLGLLFLTIAVIIFTKKKKRRLCLWDTFPKMQCLIMFTVIFGYFIVVAQISPEINNRYQFIIYPFCILLGISLVMYLLKQLNCAWAVWIAAVFCLFLIIRAYTVQPVAYVYKGYQEVLGSLAEDYKDAPGIYITAGDHLVINNCIFLEQQDRTYALTMERMEELLEICKETDADHLVLYVDIYYDESKTAQQVAQLLGYRSYALLYDNTFTQIFLLSR